MGGKKNALRSHDQYQQKLSSKHPHIIAIEQYQGYDIPIMHSCLKCGFEFPSRPFIILQTKNGCKNCAILAMTKTHEQYVTELFHVNPNIEVTEKYINAQTKIWHKCRICGKEWKIIPNNALKGKGCPDCGMQKRIISKTKTREQFVDELAKNNPNNMLIGPYNGSRKDSSFGC